MVDTEHGYSWLTNTVNNSARDSFDMTSAQGLGVLAYSCEIADIRLEWTDHIAAWQERGYDLHACPHSSCIIFLSCVDAYGVYNMNIASPTCFHTQKQVGDNKMKPLLMNQPHLNQTMPCFVWLDLEIVEQTIRTVMMRVISLESALCF